MKNQVYAITLKNDTDVIELAIVNSKGLAYQTMELYKAIYKDSVGIEITLEKSKRRLKIEKIA